jgi:hypothetical protein
MAPLLKSPHHFNNSGANSGSSHGTTPVKTTLYFKWGWFSNMTSNSPEDDISGKHSSMVITNQLLVVATEAKHRVIIGFVIVPTIGFVIVPSARIIRVK